MYTFAAGTSTPQAAYQDAAGTVPHANPIILDAKGEAVIYWSGSYKVNVKSALDLQITGWPVDNVKSDPFGFATFMTNLASSSGASMIGFDGTTLDQQFKNRVTRVADTFATIRALDSNEYTRAQAVGATAKGDGGFGDYWADPTDNVSTDDSWHTLVGADGMRWKRQRLMWQKTTTGADAPTFQFARNTSHSGGTPGVVTNALNVSATVGAAVANFEWAFLAQMDNSATGGQNVAAYGQAKKRAKGPTWAGCFEIQDHWADGANNAEGGALGIEIACSGNGTDTNTQRNGLHITLAKLNGAGTDLEWGAGIRISKDATSRYVTGALMESTFRNAAFANTGDSSAFANSTTFKDTGKAARGIDLSGATYSGSAIQLADSQILAFEATSAVKLYASGGLLVSPARLSLGNAFAVSSAGGTYATAGAATGRYLGFYEDGVLRKLQIFAA